MQTSSLCNLKEQGQVLLQYLEAFVAARKKPGQECPYKSRAGKQGWSEGLASSRSDTK